MLRLIRMQPIEETALAGRNHFPLLRLAAALLVLFAHCFHLLDRAGDEFGVRDLGWLLVICVPLTLLCAALSWHVVERRALA